ncbi:MAG: hypothetical protein AAFR16_02755 [Pseudomonadota bacterium]
MSRDQHAPAASPSPEEIAAYVAKGRRLRAEAAHAGVAALMRAARAGAGAAADAAVSATAVRAPAPAAAPRPAAA